MQPPPSQPLSPSHACHFRAHLRRAPLALVAVGQRVIDTNGATQLVRLVCQDMADLCRRAASADATSTQRPQSAAAAQRSGAPLFVAELMDTSGNGEGLLPLAKACVSSGLISADACILPTRLRLWAVLAEIRACGTAVDGAEAPAEKALDPTLPKPNWDWWG